MPNTLLENFLNLELLRHKLTFVSCRIYFTQVRMINLRGPDALYAKFYVESLTRFSDYLKKHAHLIGAGLNT